MEDETMHDSHIGRELVNATVETRRCRKCKQTGHIARYCKAKGRENMTEFKKNVASSENNKWAFSANDGDDLNDDDCILTLDRFVY
ncbi:hypothetical protein CCR75_008990 [Bremia lactucae]|uniref:CCHC-type domain-containing protein n=1 Tax=Bremia lactucae TaxID=4779 RepID=A0A976FKQ0_BRELC|nr:hypothetical protein CCR75_008990 [Bremia lactucae]